MSKMYLLSLIFLHFCCNASQALMPEVRTVPAPSHANTTCCHGNTERDGRKLSILPSWAPDSPFFCPFAFNPLHLCFILPITTRTDEDTNQPEQEARTAPHRALLHTHLSAGPAVEAVIIPAHRHISWRSLAQLQGQRLALWRCDGLKKDPVQTQY